MSHRRMRGMLSIKVFKAIKVTIKVFDDME